MNIDNVGTVSGRLAKDPKIVTNSDGSRKIFITVASQRNYKRKDGTRDVDFVQLEHYLSASKTGNGPYEFLRKGDSAGFEYTVQSNNYKDKDGEMQYKQVLAIQSVKIRSTKSNAHVEDVTEDVEPAAQPEDMPEDLPFN